ncbi:MAG TPA: hypothetical protein VLC46_05550 [Thermoanaerobaculia bacterium]|jgi:hypothetical protein|nr:hypothetical protein [Thermoanaerobaculia bacterium]
MKIRHVVVSLFACVTLLSSRAALAQYVQQGPKLVGSGALEPARQGSSVALSADGNTAIVGGDYYSFDGPAAWIWTRNGGGWTESARLAGANASAASGKDTSVAISADGNTAVVGGDIDNNGLGAVWVWTRNGDVWTQQGSKLVGSGSTAKAQQGYSVALSADGNTLIVGGPFNNIDYGAAWIWTRSGGVWTQQGPMLVGTGASDRAQQGSSVALSANGNTAIVGGPYDLGGAACIWTRSGKKWTQQGPKLVATGAAPTGRQGYSVALTADGNTAIIGGVGQGAWVWTRSRGIWTQGPNLFTADFSYQGSSVSLSADGDTAIIGGPNDAGATVIWIRNGGTWAQQTLQLVGTGASTPHDGFTQGAFQSYTVAISGALQGYAVALSADGNTAIVGGPADDFSEWLDPVPPQGTQQNGGPIPAGTGAAWIFTRSGGGWEQQGSKLVGSIVGHARQGYSVALSADGNAALVGGIYDHGNTGAAWVWTRVNGVWAQNAKLVGSDAVGYGLQGCSVALSADGNTAIVGGDFDNDDTGAAWVWIKSGGVWTQQGPKLVGSGAEGFGARQGSSVALSADGNTAIVGGVRDQFFGTLGGYPDVGIGAAWVWTRSGGVWTQQGSKLVGLGSEADFGYFTGVGQGNSVAISADGNTALVGSNGVLDVWVWTRSGGLWSQQGPKLSAAGGILGFSVALSADGNTAALGGSIWIRSTGVWTEQSGLGEGVYVSLSADGNTAVVVGDPIHVPGGASVWTRSGKTWTQRGPKLLGSDGIGVAHQDYDLLPYPDSPAGNDVAISFDGSTIILGGRDDNEGIGTAWIFAGTPADTVPRQRAVRR